MYMYRRNVGIFYFLNVYVRILTYAILAYISYVYSLFFFPVYCYCVVLLALVSWKFPIVLLGAGG